MRRNFGRESLTGVFRSRRKGLGNDAEYLAQIHAREACAPFAGLDLCNAQEAANVVRISSAAASDP